MASTPSWTAAIAAVHADPVLANAGPPIAPAPMFAIAASIGEFARQKRQSAPYVIWHPGGRDRYTKDPSPAGPHPPTAAGNIPRWICTRWISTRAFIHCLQTAPEDFDTMELTLNSFISALHRTLRGAYHLLGGGIEATHGTEGTKDRKVYVLDLELATPVTEVELESVPATITSVPFAAGFTSPTNPPQ